MTFPTAYSNRLDLNRIPEQEVEQPQHTPVSSNASIVMITNWSDMEANNATGTLTGQATICVTKLAQRLNVRANEVQQLNTQVRILQRMLAESNHKNNRLRREIKH